MSNRSGGSGCGWFLGLIALALVGASLYLGVGMSADLVTAGGVGIGQEFESMGMALLVVGLVALVLARRGER